MSEGSERHKRRPGLKAALEAARKAGLEVRAAVVEDGKVMLTFGDGTTVSTNNNEWDRRLKELGYGKN
jgi:hypothetical protein